MKRNKNTGLFGVLLSMVAVALMASCSDWTEVEYINNKKADIAEQDPAKYAKYLENLRNYKESEHTLVYTWLDNSEKTPFSRSQHITDLPDSVDVVGLISPDNLAEWELKDMETVRKDKAMKVIYNVDFDAIKAAYVLKQELATEEEPLAVDFVGFLTDSLEHSLSLAGKYNYDGICILYSGKSRIHMRPDELKEYTANERTFINIISDWHQRNPERSIAFEGCPQNLIDLTLLQDCEVVFLSAKKATNKYQFDYILSEAKSKNVLEVEPAVNFGMVVMATALDDPNKKIGYFADGSLAMVGLADWAPVTVSYEVPVKAVGVYNVSTDYYSKEGDYYYTRNLISSVNASVK